MNHIVYNRLPVKHAYNVRELGGFACAGGNVTSWKTFLRADDLTNLDDEDMRLLTQYGVSLIIDLRSDEECCASPNPFANYDIVGYVNIPLMENVIANVSEEMQRNPQAFLGSFYVNLLHEAAVPIRKVFDAMSAQQNGAVLFHCAAGKDRTGVIAALLLGLAGVCRADIVANYETTYTFIRENPTYSGQAQDYAADLLMSKSENIEKMLAHIDEKYNGVCAYLQSERVGLSDESINTIRKRFCQSASPLADMGRAAMPCLFECVAGNSNR